MTTYNYQKLRTIFISAILLLSFLSCTGQVFIGQDTIRSATMEFKEKVIQFNWKALYDFSGDIDKREVCFANGDSLVSYLKDNSREVFSRHFFDDSVLNFLISISGFIAGNYSAAIDGVNFNLKIDSVNRYSLVMSKSLSRDQGLKIEISSGTIGYVRDTIILADQYGDLKSMYVVKGSRIFPIQTYSGLSGIVLEYSPPNFFFTNIRNYPPSNDINSIKNAVVSNEFKSGTYIDIREKYISTLTNIKLCFSEDRSYKFFVFDKVVSLGTWRVNNGVLTIYDPFLKNTLKFRIDKGNQISAINGFPTYIRQFILAK